MQFILNPGGTGTLRVIRAGYEALLTDVNDIPNKKYVDDEINAVVIGANFPKIIQGDTEVKITDNSTIRSQLPKLKQKLIMFCIMEIKSFRNLQSNDRYWQYKDRR